MTMKKKPGNRSEGLNMSYHGDHLLQKGGVEKMASVMGQAATPGQKRTADDLTVEAMLREADLPEHWSSKERADYTVLTLCRLDPMRWRYDKEHDVWRYYMDGGMTLVVPNKVCPDLGVLCDAHDAIIIPVVWTDNLLPETVKKYWDIVFNMDELLNQVELEREDLTERILDVRERLEAEGRESEGRIPRLPEHLRDRKKTPPEKD